MVNVRIFDRYIFRELIVPFFLSMAALTLVFFIQKMFRLAELVVSKGASFLETFKLMLFIMPSFLAITIPMSTLVASLTAFTRLSSDAEITAMKASRVSLYDMLRPVAAFTALAFATSAFISLLLMPVANQALRVQLFNLVKSKAMVGIESGVFSSTFDGMVIYVDRMGPTDDLEGIFISDERTGRMSTVITAKGGKLIADPRSFSVTLAMEDGAVHTPPKDPQSYTQTIFRRGKLYLDINRALMSGASGQNRDVKEQGTRELWKTIRANRPPDLAAEHEFYKRVTIPFACLFFGIIGAPLGIRRGRSGKTAGVAVALGVFLTYYLMIGTGRNLAQAGTISVALAYWVPNVVMVATTVVLVFIRGHEISLLADLRPATVLAWIKERLQRTP